MVLPSPLNVPVNRCEKPGQSRHNRQTRETPRESRSLR
jgi:hypothetical protein